MEEEKAFMDWNEDSGNEMVPPEIEPCDDEKENIVEERPQIEYDNGEMHFGQLLLDDLMNTFCDRLQKVASNTIEGMLAIQFILLEPSLVSSVVSGDHPAVQILFDPLRSHYVVVSFCPQRRTVAIHDPLYRSRRFGDTFTFPMCMQINSIFGHLFEDKVVPVSIDTTCDPQYDVWSCGYRALACCVDIARGKDPASTAYSPFEIYGLLSDVMKAGDDVTWEIFENANLGDARPVEQRLWSGFLAKPTGWETADDWQEMDAARGLERIDRYDHRSRYDVTSRSRYDITDRYDVTNRYDDDMYDDRDGRRRTRRITYDSDDDMDELDDMYDVIVGDRFQVYEDNNNDDLKGFMSDVNNERKSDVISSEYDCVSEEDGNENMRRFLSDVGQNDVIKEYVVIEKENDVTIDKENNDVTIDRESSDVIDRASSDVIDKENSDVTIRKQHRDVTDKENCDVIEMEKSGVIDKENNDVTIKTQNIDVIGKGEGDRDVTIDKENSDVIGKNRYDVIDESTDDNVMEYSMENTAQPTPAHPNPEEEALRVSLEKLTAQFDYLSDSDEGNA